MNHVSQIHESDTDVTVCEVRDVVQWETWTREKLYGLAGTSGEALKNGSYLERLVGGADGNRGWQGEHK